LGLERDRRMDQKNESNEIRWRLRDFFPLINAKVVYFLEPRSIPAPVPSEDSSTSYESAEGLSFDTKSIL
jgi:hypothetical protein